MRIAILGASSEIARDFILALSSDPDYTLHLFARQPVLLNSWLISKSPQGEFSCHTFDEFTPQTHFDAIINFVGVGNPSKTLALGAGIFDITWQYDQVALDYLKIHPTCKYIFLSSGAAFCSDYLEPLNYNSKSIIDLNNIKQQDWYGLAKLQAECRHRALLDYSITDIRIFNYFSHTQDMDASFFITDVFKSIKNNSVLKTNSININRDYIDPSDLKQLFKLAVHHKGNLVVDAYSKKPISKFDLLNDMQNNFNLKFDVIQAVQSVQATGVKMNYYSTNTVASTILGFDPLFASSDTVITQMTLALQL